MGENLFARCVRLILQRAGRTELGSRGRLGAGGMALGGQRGGAGAVDQALGLGDVAVFAGGHCTGGADGGLVGGCGRAVLLGLNGGGGEHTPFRG